MVTLLIILSLAVGGYTVTALGWRVFLNSILSKWEEIIQATVPPVPAKIKYLGGPYDGRVDLIQEEMKKPFFIAPYVPKEEDKRGEVFGVINGIPMHKPNLAYYREVTDEEYFYVRDISHSEYEHLVETGTPPTI
jgi:hypothetical protein